MVTLAVAVRCLLVDLLQLRAADVLRRDLGLCCAPLLLLPPLLLLFFLVLPPPTVAPPVRLHLLPAVSLPAAAHAAEPAGRLVRAHVCVQQTPGRQHQGTQEAP